jgi:hypothetical protein
MSYEVLVAIVVINAIVTISLWRQIATKANRPARPYKKAAKALWHSDPIVPRHDPPKVVGADFPSVADDADRMFFDDFKEFADVVNWWLAEGEYSAGRFRLQDLPVTVLRLNIPHDLFPRALGRCFAVYYNQRRVGRVEIGPRYGYAIESPQVNTSVLIDWSRFLAYGALTKFLSIIASHVTNPNLKSDEYVVARQRIDAALMELLWNNYSISENDYLFHQDADWGELNVGFHGSAEWYFERRTAWQKAAATNKVDAASAPIADEPPRQPAPPA